MPAMGIQKRRIRVCFAQPVMHGSRYQEWVKCLLYANDVFAVQYLDLDLPEVDVADNGLTKAVKKIRRIFKKIRLIPPILSSDIVVFNKFLHDEKLYHVARMSNKKIVLDAYISKYQTLVCSRKVLVEKSKKAERLRQEERDRFDGAEVVIFLNRTERDFYCSVLDAYPRRSCIIPLHNSPKRTAKLGFLKGCKEKPLFCWWGGENNPIHGLGNIIHALEILEKQVLEFKFEIFGTNEHECVAYYRGLLEEVGWEGKVVPRYDLRMSDGSLEEYLVENCDFAFGLLSDEDKAVNVIANKVLDCINMQIPFWTADSPALREFFSENEICYCEDISPQALAAKIAETVNDQDIQRRLEKASESFAENFSLDKLNHKFIEVLKSIS